MNEALIYQIFLVKTSRRIRNILFYHQKYDFEKIASKFETLYFSTLKQRKMKSLRIIFDRVLSFEIETFLGCL